MKVKMFVAMTAVLAVASSSMAAIWMHEDFESYSDNAWDVWQQLTGRDLSWQTEWGYEGPQCVGGTKGHHRRHVRDLVPDIQAAPGGAGMTSVIATNSSPIFMEVAIEFRESGVAETQAFYFHLAKGPDGPPTEPDPNPHSALAFGPFATYDGTAARAGLMYYDGLNWTELISLNHGTEQWNFIKAVIRETTVDLMYFDETMSNGMQKVTVDREYLGGFDTMGISAAPCPARIRATDAYYLSDGVFVPEPATVLLLGLGGVALLRRRRRVT